MRFLVDACLSGFLVRELRNRGWDVKWMIEISPDASDDEVIGIAMRENRVLLTADVGLASRTLWEPQCNVATILLRLASLPYQEAAIDVAHMFAGRDDWHLLHAVITPKKLRTRPRLLLIKE